MRTSVRHVSRLRLPQVSSPSYRLRLLRRTSSARRAFHSAKKLRTDQNDPADTSQPAWNLVAETTPEIIAENLSGKEIENEADSPEAPQAADGADATNEGKDGTPDKLPAPKDRSVYGSGRKRLTRQYKYKGPDPPNIPYRFRDSNVVLYEDLRDQQSRLQEYSAVRNLMQGEGPVRDQPSGLTGIKLFPKDPTSKGQQLAGEGQETDGEFKGLDDKAQGTVGGLGSSTNGSPYEIDYNVLRELNSLVSAGLHSPAAEQVDDPLNSRSNMLLQCPKDGGTLFLDTVVRYLAGANSADLITLDPQDISEMGSDYLYGLRDGDKLRQLSYDAYSMLGQRNNYAVEDAEEQDFEEADEAEQDPSQRKTGYSFSSMPRMSAVPLIAVSGQMPAGILDVLKNALKSLPNTANGEGQALPTSSSLQSKDGLTRVVLPIADRTSEQRMSLLIDTILDCSQMKRQDASRTDTTTRTSVPNEGDLMEEEAYSQEPNDLPSPRSQPGRRDLIIHIRDYAEINTTQAGSKFLGRLHDVVWRRRKEEQRLLIIGTTSAEELIPSMSKSGFRHVQLEGGSGPLRTVIVPCGSASSEVNFGLDTKSRTKRINFRHLQYMLRQLSSGHDAVYEIVFQDELAMDSSDAFLSDIEETIWSSERVNRIATVALGLLKPNEEMTSKHLVAALDVIHKSDEAKYEWIGEDREYSKKYTKSTSVPGPEKISEQRLQKLRKTCNSYEKKLLHGVVDAAAIRTTFADVRAPMETIEALKTLTSLSLIRPEAFTYGVLATDKIPGLLLYGPPGTGKTLLAKAVAKESGATVLEISGSDVYDMYVGEGEKNVRAIFSLAKKLTPCVVFIDEADAIFGSRGTSTNRTSHRELINQFLREWDGMSDLSAFIMVATNRPFDLDDAVLRRLPRRLLVDLPTEKDREAILEIHLKDEALHPDVSISDIASKTALYSGSDLKNIAVAAALACVRDENDAAIASKATTPEKPYLYPQQRTLEPKHFTKAVEEISASISEDMSSLTAIRKFDEKFGDRRGRRKKMGGYGFGTLTEKEREMAGADAARVRKQT